MSAKHLREFYLEGMCEDATYNEVRSALLVESAELLSSFCHDTAVDVLHEEILTRVGNNDRFLELWAKKDEETE